jgi:hypothetical protein
MSQSKTNFLSQTSANIQEFMGMPAKECRLQDVLDKMTQEGSSVLLNWGEDTNNWECSWITGGRRYVSHAAWLEGAIAHCIGQVLWEVKQRKDQ